MDIVSPEKRSRMMGGIRSGNTKPELVVRSIAHRLGLRYRLHSKNLPGRPDIVFARHRTAIFVHGCFWHRHDCGLAAVPKTRTDFWLAKFAANVERDRLCRAALEKNGWRVLEIWECETRDPATVRRRLEEHFDLMSSNTCPAGRASVHSDVGTTNGGLQGQVATPRTSMRRR
jgi:DNA mismatch endonuclease, patch repair protein